MQMIIAQLKSQLQAQEVIVVRAKEEIERCKAALCVAEGNLIRYKSNYDEIKRAIEKLENN